MFECNHHAEQKQHALEMKSCVTENATTLAVNGASCIVPIVVWHVMRTACVVGTGEYLHNKKQQMRGRNIRVNSNINYKK